MRISDWSSDVCSSDLRGKVFDVNISRRPDVGRQIGYDGGTQAIALRPHTIFCSVDQYLVFRQRLMPRNNRECLSDGPRNRDPSARQDEARCPRCAAYLDTFIAAEI